MQSSSHTICRVSDLGILSPERGVSLKFYMGSGNPVEEEAERMSQPKEMVGAKETGLSKHNRMDAHMSSQRLR